MSRPGGGARFRRDPEAKCPGCDDAQLTELAGDEAKHGGGTAVPQEVQGKRSLRLEALNDA